VRDRWVSLRSTPSYAPTTGPNQGLATAGMGRINLGRQ